MLAQNSLRYFDSMFPEDGLWPEAREINVFQTVAKRPSAWWEVMKAILKTARNVYSRIIIVFDGN